MDPTTIQAGTPINISLTNALIDINAHRGGLFAVGGAVGGTFGQQLNLIDQGGPYYLSGGTFAPFAQLTLQTSVSSVPEPTAGLLMLIGLSGLIMWRHFARKER